MDGVACRRSMETEGCLVGRWVGWGRIGAWRPKAAVWWEDGLDGVGTVGAWRPKAAWFEDGLDGALAPKAASWWDYWFGEGVPGAVGVGKPKAGGRIGLARGFPGSKGIDLFSHEV